MKSLKTKIATVFSLLCLALSLSVFGVFSAITIQNKTTGQFGYIDKTCYLQSSDGTIKEFYSTIQKAYSSATDGDTICVFTTSAFNEDLNITKNISVKAVQNAVTLDLGTYNISVGEGGSLTLGDSTYTSTSPVLTIESSDTTQNALINNTSSLVVNNGVVLKSSRATTLQNQGNLIINGGTINKALTGQVYSAVKNIGSGNVSITGGNISVESGNYSEEIIGVAVLNEGSGNITVSGSNNIEISGDVGIATSSNILDSLLSMTDTNAPSGKIIVNNAQANLSCSLAGIFSSSSSSDGVTLNAGTIIGIDNGIQSGITTIGNCGIVIDAKGKVDISDALYGLASSGGNVDVTGNSPVNIEGSTGIAVLETTANVYLNNPNLNITAYSDGENSFSGIGVLYYTPSGILNIQDCGTISGEVYSISVSGESNVSVTVSSGTFNGSVFLISADFTATGDAKFVMPRVVDGSYASAIGSLFGDITIIGNNVTFDSDSAISLGGKGSVLTLENANITGVKEGVTLNTATLEVLGTTTINATEKAISVVSGSGEKVILNGALNIIGGIEVDALDYSTTSAPIIEIGTNFSTQDAITLLLNDTHIGGRMIAVYKDATMANNFSKHFTHQYGLFLRGTTLCIGTLVSAPTAGQSPYVYTGNVITHLTGIDSSKMTVYGTNSATDAGSYSVTVGLNGDQYCWADTYNRESKKYSWQITPKTIQKPQLVNNSFVYNGSNQAIAFNPAVDSTSTTVTGTQSATNVGNYSVTLTLKNTKNYVWSDNSTSAYSLSWKITPKTLNKPTMSGGPFTYDGSAKTITISGFDSGTMNRTGYTATNAGSYQAVVSLKDKSNYTWSDGTTTDVTYNWTINKLEVTIPTANPASYTYNDGKAINLTLTNPDSSYITLGGDLSGTDVGSYTATATLKDTNNYTWSDGSNTTKNISWNITKKQLSIPTLDSANFTYNGSAHTISFTGYNSSTMTLGGTQTATNAGNYQATISLKDTSNYSWAGGATTAQTYNWSISKAKLTKPTTGTNSFVYTGSLITYTPNNYSSSTMNISGNTATNVGSYTASVSIKDTTNYIWSDNTTQAVSLGWNITAKLLDKPTMSGGPFTYDGSAKTITISGFDAKTMTRSGYTATNAGSYTARIALKDKANYTWSDGTTTDVTYNWTINKRQLTIPTLGQTSYAYTGATITPTITNPDSAYITIGGSTSGVNANTYTITATINDTNNNQWKDGTTRVASITWTITKLNLIAPNGLSWTVSSDKSTVTANWNAVSGRTSYTLTVLINGSSKLTKSNITNTKYTFDTTEFNNLSIGTFTFTVQAIGDANHNSSAVSGASGNLYRLVFMTNYGTSAVHARQYYVANTTYSAPANPSRTGYTMAGWATSSTGNVVTMPTTVSSSVTYYAKWNAINYAITINSNGGSGGSVNANTYNISPSQQTRTLTNPSRVGYTLSGWSVVWSDSTHSVALPTISGTTLTIPANCYGNITISANWSANTNTAYKVEHYKENIDVASPSESTSSHWTLAQTDNLTGTTGASVTPSRKTYTGFTSPSAKTATINADGSTVVRYYYTRNTYTITLSRGTGISSVSGGGTYDYGKSITVTASVNSGYSFSRWTSSNASLLANSSKASYTFSVPAGNVTLTASASLVTYTITFNRNNGTWTSGYSAPSSYNINSSTITLPTVSNIYRTNYIFGGWYTSSTFSGSAVTSIPQGSTGNKTFYAKWTSAAVYNTTLHLGYSNLTSAINGASGNGSDVLDVRINLPSTTTYNVNKNLTILTNVTSGVTIAGGFNLSGTSGQEGNGTLGGGSGMLTIQGPISLNNTQFVGTGKVGVTHWTMKNNMSYSSNSNTNNITIPQNTYLTVAGATLSADYRVITVSGGSVAISSGTVQAKGSGPALYVLAGSSATMSGSAKVTGYIGVQVLGNFTMGGGSITSTLQGISNESSGVTTIQAGTITGPTAISNKGTNTNSLTITGGTITGTNYGIDNNMTGTVNISGGTISATASDSGVGIINNQSGTVNISGSGTLTISGSTGISNVSSGTITVNNSNATISGIRYGIDITNGIVNVYNGKVQGTGTSGIGIDLGNLINTTARLNVTGGLIVGVFRGINTYGILNISGGTVRATGENGNAVGDNGFGRGEITISNGVFEATGANGSGFDSTGVSGITITGGTFSGTLAGIATSATTTITDATITGTLYGVYNRGSKVTIGGGTIKGTGPDGIGIYNFGSAVEISGSSALMVTGNDFGIYNGNLNEQSTKSTITITNSRAYINGSVAIYNSSSNSSAITITAGTIGENSISTVVGLGSGAGTVDITGGEFNGDTAGIVIDYGTAVIGGSASLYGITGLYIGYNATQSGNTNVTVNGSASINGDNAIIIGSGTLGSLTISGSPVIGDTYNNYGISCEASSFQIKISGSPTIRGRSAGIDIHSGGTLSLSGTPLISEIYTKSYSQTTASISVTGTFNPRALITLSISPATLGNFVVFYSSSSYASSWASQFHWTNSTYELSLYNGYYLWITRAVNRAYNVDKGTYYTDLNSAILAASSGDTLRIMESVTAIGTWTIEKDITIISSDDTNVLDGDFFVSNGTLVLDGTSTILTITGGIRVEGELYVTGEVNIKNDSASDSSSTAIQIDYGTATIEGGGSISSTNGYAIEILNGSVTLDGTSASLNISGYDYDIWSSGGVDGQIIISGDIGNGFSIWLDWIDDSSPSDTSLPEVAIYLETRLSGNANSFVYVFYDNWEGTTGAVFYSAYSITYSTDYIYVGDRIADSGSPWSPFTDDSPGNNYHVFEACFDENTWIYYYDEKKKKIRRKRAKNVKYKDKLLVWNFDKGCFDFANPLFIQRTEIANKYTQIKFSDGSYLNIVGDHTVYNADDRYFTPIVSNEHYGTPIGTKVMKWDGSIVTIVSKKTIYKKIPYTNIITNYHMNCFTNGILTSTPFNNMYRIDENMKFIVNSDKYCRMVSLLDGIDKKFIEGLRLMEFPDKVLVSSPKNAGCKSFKEYIDKKLGVQKESD